MKKKNIMIRLANFACISFMAMTMCFCAQPKDKQKKADAASETACQCDQEVKEFNEVDVKPLFNGGDANQFAQWVGSNLKYPEECMNEGISGRVVISFTIGTDGKLKDIKVLKGVHEKIDAEALRVIGMSPDWTPGMHEGKAVPVSFILPIAFKF